MLDVGLALCQVFIISTSKPSSRYILGLIICLLQNLQDLLGLIIYATAKPEGASQK